MGKITAICISDVRGVQKTPIKKATLKLNFGIEGDAHGGNWHRQVSLISAERIAEFKEKGADVNDGAFGENIIATGLDFKALPVGTVLKAGTALLEMTQIGKECHSHCAIYHAVGDCIMPREGVFAKVIQQGTISVGDAIEIVKQEKKRPYQVAVITLSDKCFAKERQDKSGPLIAKKLLEQGFEIQEQLLIPDERELLIKNLIRLADQRQLDLIITTGGTGLSARDITPEATMEVATKNVPGIAEGIRGYSMKITPMAMLSRGVSVVRNRTLIINLPGSPKACGECLDFLIPCLSHGLEVLRGDAVECANLV